MTEKEITTFVKNYEMDELPPINSFSMISRLVAMSKLMNPSKPLLIISLG